MKITPVNSSRCIVFERGEQPPAGDPVLRVANVTASYSGTDVNVVNDVSVDVYPGQTLAVVGESGSGKSTLARVTTGLLPPLPGSSVSFAGRELPGAFYFGLRGRERQKRVAGLLDQIEMGEGFIDRYPAELSGGQKQRVCIARALAADQKLIICDEVTSALDPLVADGILKLLLELQRVENVTYLSITHDLATVKPIADSIVVIYQGSVVRYGPKSEVLAPPFDDYTQLLLASVPELEIGWLAQAIESRRMQSAGH